jgi:cytochrome d ubiquinol oxidase subunit I
VPPDDRPPANTLLHLAFDAMVGICVALMGLGLWLGIAWWRKRDIPQTRWFLRTVAVSGVLGIVALECGWIVTEVGRQPWIVYNVMRTEDAVTDAGGVSITLAGVVLLYIALGIATVVVLRAMSRRWRTADVDDETDVPYGPRPSVPEVGS